MASYMAQSLIEFRNLIGNLPSVGPRGYKITEPLSPVERIRSSVLRNSRDFSM